jgi:hypothetical protein
MRACMYIHTCTYVHSMYVLCVCAQLHGIRLIALAKFCTHRPAYPGPAPVENVSILCRTRTNIAGAALHGENKKTGTGQGSSREELVPSQPRPHARSILSPVCIVLLVGVLSCMLYGGRSACMLCLLALPGNYLLCIYSVLVVHTYLYSGRCLCSTSDESHHRPLLRCPAAPARSRIVLLASMRLVPAPSRL